MRCIALMLGAAVIAGPVTVAAQAKPDHPKSQTAGAVSISVPRPLLPESFAGWEQSDAPRPLADPAQVDSANTAALKEYGFQNGLEVHYKKAGETLTLRALRFNDLSGAYGAYSFYRANGWPREDIGNGAASYHNRVLFWQGSTVVDATFSHVNPMTGSELRELATQLPTAQGTRALAPPILSDLPKKSLDAQTTHYAVGSASYAGSGGVLPPDLVGFDRGAETVTANYTLNSGPAVLTLIDYPTPQMAQAQEARIRDYLKAGANAQPAFPKPLQDSDQASLEVRRTGPVVALVSGDAIPDESHKLLASVHYESEYVSIPQPTESEVSKTGKLLLGIAELVIIGSVAALLLGFFLGGGRALYRMAKGKPASSLYEAEFIRLDLRE
ncbi:hypothetical protein DYQ86_14315 [Acidobacteria bacterium AB60]|nr:hypothetical protein DYQ86_14315 [Acidobacteria bacterium AB60]